MTAPGTAREDHQSMEFSVSKSALVNELNTTQGVVERKTTIPILSNLLVEAKGSRLTITATDLELSVRTSCEAKVKKEGAGTIPAKKLLELVPLLPEGEIKFKLLENHWVEIVSDKKKYKLVGMAKENFPALPAMPHVLVNSRASHRKPDRQNKIRHFHGGIPLHAERWLADSQTRHARHGRHRWAPPGACRDRSKTSGFERRSEGSDPQEGHGRSRKTVERRGFRSRN